MAKRPPKDPIVKPLQRLFDPDATVRAEAVRALRLLGEIDMVDLRDVQALVAWLLLHDAAPEVRREAMALTEFRASSGCDIGFAIPALLHIADDPTAPPKLRDEARQALRYSEKRTPVQALFAKRE